MNIYYIRSELNEGRISAYSETFWLSKVANGQLHLKLCKDTDLELTGLAFEVRLE
jgi:hypothetical protein